MGRPSAWQAGEMNPLEGTGWWPTAMNNLRGLADQHGEEARQ